MNCDHDWVPTFEGGDTYRCRKCGKKIDMTETDEP
jgi:DNA-directed RNA polymerase subunit RPC12/RpoP